MNKKIAIIGYNKLGNIGDNILMFCTQQLLKKKYEDCSFCLVDADPIPGFIPSICYIVFQCISKAMSFLGCTSLSEKMKYLAYQCRYKKSFEHSLCEYDAIIIAIGYIHCSNLRTDNQIAAVVTVAKKNNIPVMISAASFDAYNKDNFRLCILSEILKSDIIKIITTRDGDVTVNELVKHYGLSHDKVFACGDIALFLNDLVYPRGCKKDAVGIGVIRPNICDDKNGTLSETQITSLYISLIHSLLDKGICFRLFSNGLESDNVFGRYLLDYFNLPHNMLIERYDSIQDYVDSIVSFRAVFAGRMHALIVAYTCGIPIKCFAWDTKILYFIKSIQAESDVLTLDLDNIDEVMEFFRKGCVEKHDTTRLKDSTVKYLYFFVEQYVL